MSYCLQSICFLKIKQMFLFMGLPCVKMQCIWKTIKNIAGFFSDLISLKIYDMKNY